MEFFGRVKELERFAAFLGGTGQAVALVYGRRRIGKSELIKQALGKSGCRCVYYECKQTSEASNVASLASLVSEELGYPPLAFDDMESLLGFLFSEAGESGLTLVLDEYPYLREVVPGLDSVVQAIVDGHAGSSNMKLVLCGSYVSVMKSLLEEENPLYGRVVIISDFQPRRFHSEQHPISGRAA